MERAEVIVAEHQGVLVLPRSRDLGDELRVLRFIGSLQRHVDQASAPWWNHAWHRCWNGACLVSSAVIPMMLRHWT